MDARGHGHEFEPNLGLPALDKDNVKECNAVDHRLNQSMLVREHLAN